MIHKIVIFTPGTGDYIVEIYGEANGVPEFRTEKFKTSSDASVFVTILLQRNGSDKGAVD